MPTGRRARPPPRSRRAALSSPPPSAGARELDSLKTFIEDKAKQLLDLTTA